MSGAQTVGAARQRIHGIAHRTPVHTCAAIDREAGARVFLKCESLQRVGAFKFRGACNAVLSLSQEERARGVITHSSGNHAQGLALAARLAGVAATIVMPHDAPEVKRAATLGYGARIVPCDARDREAVCAAEMERTGAVLIHPYDDDRIIAGAGTATAELLDEVGDLDALFVPVGGGGLSSGACLAAEERGAPVAIVGVEPEGGDDARRSLETGRIVTLDTVPATIADGLRTRSIGERNLVILGRRMAAVLAVSDDEIRAALRLLVERAKLVVEPSGAAALAGLLSGRHALPAGARVGVVVSGGNVDPAAMSRLLG